MIHLEMSNISKCNITRCVNTCLVGSMSSFTFIYRTMKKAFVFLGRVPVWSHPSKGDILCVFLSVATSENKHQQLPDYHQVWSTNS